MLHFLLLLSLNYSIQTTSKVVPYPTLLKNIKTTQQTLNGQFNTTTKDSILLLASNNLYTTLVDSIFPAWYNTPWDFNGISNEPQKGQIACGYFVSTTLKHVGFNLNRYKLAQQAATIITSEITDTLRRYTSKVKLLQNLKNQPDNLYVVGLDYHVGFLVVQNKEVYFVHSDYFQNKVVREIAATSVGFSATKAYVLGNITNNPKLMTRWLNNQIIYPK